MNTPPAIIYRERLNDAHRVTYTANLFGANFPMRLEPFVFNMAGQLSADYRGGFWHFYALSNDGFYLAPEIPEIFAASSENGYRHTITADALGIVACLYAYSHLSFSTQTEFAEVSARQYHLLRDYAFEHQEASQIFRLID